MGLWSRLLDSSVVFSFDRSGFKRRAKHFTPDDPRADLSHLHVVITGANSGIGYGTAEALVGRGAQVTLVCRSQVRGEGAIAALRKQWPESRLTLRLADLSDLGSVRALATEITEPIHALVHNAGNMLDELSYTDDGIETITALHVAGPYLLSLALLDNLAAGARQCHGRIIFVASGGMYTQPLDLATLKTPATPYDGTRHYALTKRAQVVLAERLNASLPPGVSAHAMHPGWVDTPAIRRAMPRFYAVTKPILRTPDQGADTVFWLASTDASTVAADPGFWFDRQRVPTHMSKKTQGLDEEEAGLVPFVESLVHPPAPSV